jgi:Phage terminase, small subunit
MPKRLTPVQERFCSLYVSSGNAAEAYRRAGYHAKDADVCACKLLGTAKIANHLQELKAKNDRKMALSRDEALNILAEIARGPRDEFIRASDQERAIEIASRMCGWNEPDEVRLSAANTLTGYLLELRKESLNAPMLLEDEQKPDNGADNGLNEEGANDMISASIDTQRLRS